jgi:hypothetical protein
MPRSTRPKPNPLLDAAGCGRTVFYFPETGGVPWV